MDKPGLSGALLKFNRLGAGKYQSRAYDGFARLDRTYTISRFQGGEWQLQIDHVWQPSGFETLIAAKQAATDHAREGDDNG